MTLLDVYKEAYKEGLKRAPAAIERLCNARLEPPVPVMPQEEYDALPDHSMKKIMLICNMPGCPNVVSTHGGLCVEHTEAWEKDHPL
jgi:hypothetical protein